MYTGVTFELSGQRNWGVGARNIMKARNQRNNPFWKGRCYKQVDPVKVKPETCPLNLVKCVALLAIRSVILVEWWQWRSLIRKWRKWEPITLQQATAPELRQLGLSEAELRSGVFLVCFFFFCSMCGMCGCLCVCLRQNRWSYLIANGSVHILFFI